MDKLIVAVTGATGAIYPRRLVEVLAENGQEVALIVSKWGEEVALHETEISWDSWLEQHPNKSLITKEGWENLASPLSSGSYPTKGMIIAPCSMGTLGGIAGGISRNLIERAADVTLKERRPLILMVRETPFNTIHLENMTRLSKMGAIIAPPLPSFYNRPKSLNEIIDQSVGRTLSLLGVKTTLAPIWKP